MRFARLFGATLLTVLVTLGAADAALRAAFPVFPRFQDNFSAAYLSRDIRLGRLQESTVFIGDSVLWGYGLPASDAAATLLQRKGYAVVNLSFEGGSMANTYAMLRLLQSRGVKPRRVLFNINIKEFNQADSAYRTLYPALETLSWNSLDAQDHALLDRTQKQTLDSRLDRAISRYWLLYGMRSDEREAIFGHADAVTALQDEIETLSGTKARREAAHRPTPDKFLGTYDLTPLSATNDEVIFLRKTIALLRGWGVPAVAVLTPANHTLLHEYIDVPDYDAQLAYVTRLCGKAVTVVNLDRAFRASEFLDNDHLTAAGNRRLAAILEPYVR